LCSSVCDAPTADHKGLEVTKALSQLITFRDFVPYAKPTVSDRSSRLRIVLERL